jgi:hypothetical protein
MEGKLNFDGINDMMPRRQTINECLRAQPSIGPAHSNGKPVVSSTTTNLNDRFAPISPPAVDFTVRFVLKRHHRHAFIGSDDYGKQRTKGTT